MKKPAQPSGRKNIRAAKKDLAVNGLRESENGYRRLVEAMPDLTFVVDRSGCLTYINPAFTKETGYGPELLGQAFVSVVAPSSRSVVLEKFRQGLKGQETPPYQICLTCRNGKELPLEIHVLTLFDESGQAGGRLGIGRNLRERRAMGQLESQLRQAHKMEAIGTLASGIAHDFNNILSSMIGNTELAREETNPEIRAHCLEQVLIACERARNLVGQILLFSRRKKMELISFDVRPVVKETIKFLKSTLPASIQIRQKMTPEAALVEADPTQIQQVVMNLFTNAAGAMREDGGVLTISVDVADVSAGEIFPLAAGPYVHVTVSDTGVGIDPDFVDRIYDPFFTTKTSEEGGTGLGLSIVYNIVANLSGAITVSSEPGRGSSFHIYLPGQPAPDIKGEVQAGARNIRGGRERILFIDDEAPIVMLAGKILKGLGYSVEEAPSGEKALHLFRQDPGRFDMVITDMTMPGMTGLALASEISRIRRDIPIILCTGFTETLMDERIEAIGVRRIIYKPLTTGELANTIREVLDGRTALTDGRKGGS